MERDELLFFIRMNNPSDGFSDFSICSNIQLLEMAIEISQSKRSDFIPTVIDLPNEDEIKNS